MIPLSYSGNMYNPKDGSPVEWNPSGWNEGYAEIFQKNDSFWTMVFCFDCYCPEDKDAVLNIKRWDNGLTYVRVPFHVTKTLLEEYSAAERLVIKLIIDFIYSGFIPQDSPRCVHVTDEEVREFRKVSWWTIEAISFE